MSFKENKDDLIREAELQIQNIISDLEEKTLMKCDSILDKRAGNIIYENGEEVFGDLKVDIELKEDEEYKEMLQRNKSYRRKQNFKRFLKKVKKL